MEGKWNALIERVERICGECGGWDGLVRRIGYLGMEMQSTEQQRLWSVLDVGDRLKWTTLLREDKKDELICLSWFVYRCFELLCVFLSGADGSDSKLNSVCIAFGASNFMDLIRIVVEYIFHGVCLSCLNEETFLSFADFQVSMLTDVHWFSLYISNLKDVSKAIYKINNGSDESIGTEVPGDMDCVMSKFSYLNQQILNLNKEEEGKILGDLRKKAVNEVDTPVSDSQATVDTALTNASSGVLHTSSSPSAASLDLTNARKEADEKAKKAVSYTHLTLPTIYSV